MLAVARWPGRAGGTGGALRRPLLPVGAAEGNQEITCRACPQAFYIETIYVIPLKKTTQEGMVQYMVMLLKKCVLETASY